MLNDIARQNRILEDDSGAYDNYDKRRAQRTRNRIRDRLAEIEEQEANVPDQVLSPPSSSSSNYVPNTTMPTYESSSSSSSPSSVPNAIMPTVESPSSLPSNNDEANQSSDDSSNSPSSPSLNDAPNSSSNIPSNEASGSQSNNPSNTRPNTGSLLDDFADTSTEPMEYGWDGDI